MLLKASSIRRISLQTSRVRLPHQSFELNVLANRRVCTECERTTRLNKCATGHCLEILLPPHPRSAPANKPPAELHLKAAHAPASRSPLSPLERQSIENRLCATDTTCPSTPAPAHAQELPTSAQLCNPPLHSET